MKKIQTMALTACMLAFTAPSYAGWLDDNKVLVGTTALGVVGMVKDKLDADEKAKNEAKQQEVQAKQESAEKASRLAKEDKIEGNFGFKLGEKFDKSKCLKGTHNVSYCNVGLNGNTFFNEALVFYDPKTMKIAQITGRVKTKRFTVPKELKGNSSSTRDKHEYVTAQSAMYPHNVGKLIHEVFLAKGILNKDDQVDWAGSFYDGEVKSIFVSSEMKGTNMGNKYVQDPYAEVQVSFHYRHKPLYESMFAYLKQQDEKARNAKKESLMHNF